MAGSSPAIPLHVESDVRYAIARISNPALDVIDVRRPAVEELGCLAYSYGAALLTPHASEFCALLSHDDVRTREVALEALAKLDAAVLAEQLPFILPFLHVDNPLLRDNALRCLAVLAPVVLAGHETAVLSALEDASPYVRDMAIECLSKLEACDRERHMPAVLAMLEDTSWRVLQAALQFLARLPVALLLPHRATIAAMMSSPHDRHGFVQRAASECLALLSEPPPPPLAVDPVPNSPSPPPPPPPPPQPSPPQPPPPPPPPAATPHDARKARRAHTEKLRRQQLKEAAAAGDVAAQAKREAELKRIAKRFPSGFRKRTADEECERSQRRRVRVATEARDEASPAFPSANAKLNAEADRSQRRREQRRKGNAAAIAALPPCGVCGQPIVANRALWVHHVKCRCSAAFHVPCLRSWQAADTRKLPLRCNFKTVREADDTCPSCKEGITKRDASERERMIIVENTRYRMGKWHFYTEFIDDSREVALRGPIAQLFAMPDPGESNPADTGATSSAEPPKVPTAHPGPANAHRPVPVGSCDPACRVFVQNLDWSTDEDVLTTYLETAIPGGVASVCVLRRARDGRSRGIAKVVVRARADARTVIEELHGKELDGRVLEFAHDRL